MSTEDKSKRGLKEHTQRVREDLKKEFPSKDGWKFSVTFKSVYGIDVHILTAPYDLFKPENEVDWDKKRRDFEWRNPNWSKENIDSHMKYLKEDWNKYQSMYLFEYQDSWGWDDDDLLSNILTDRAKKDIDKIISIINKDNYTISEGDPYQEIRATYNYEVGSLYIGKKTYDKNTKPFEVAKPKSSSKAPSKSTSYSGKKRKKIETEGGELIHTCSNGFKVYKTTDGDKETIALQISKDATRVSKQDFKQMMSEIRTKPKLNWRYTVMVIHTQIEKGNEYQFDEAMSDVDTLCEIMNKYYPSSSTPKSEPTPEPTPTPQSKEMTIEEKAELFAKKLTEAKSVSLGEAYDEEFANRPNYKWTRDEYIKNMNDVFTSKPKRKYINIDYGSSGVMMIDKSTGTIYGIKAYGQVNTGRTYRNVDFWLENDFEVRKFDRFPTLKPKRKKEPTPEPTPQQKGANIEFKFMSNYTKEGTKEKLIIDKMKEWYGKEGFLEVTPISDYKIQVVYNNHEKTIKIPFRVELVGEIWNKLELYALITPSLHYGDFIDSVTEESENSYEEYITAYDNLGWKIGGAIYKLVLDILKQQEEEPSEPSKSSSPKNYGDAIEALKVMRDLNPDEAQKYTDAIDALELMIELDPSKMGNTKKEPYTVEGRIAETLYVVEYHGSDKNWDTRSVDDYKVYEVEEVDNTRSEIKLKNFKKFLIGYISGIVDYTGISDSGMLLDRKIRNEILASNNAIIIKEEKHVGDGVYSIKVKGTSASINGIANSLMNEPYKTSNGDYLFEYSSHITPYTSRIYYPNKPMLSPIKDVVGHKFEHGGMVHGPSHDNGGVKFVVKGTGQVVELEGGEGVIKKSAMNSEQEYTVSGTPREITSALNEEYGGKDFGTEDAKLKKK